MMAEVDLCYNNSVNAMRMVCLDEALIWVFFCWGRFLAHRASSGRRGASLVVRLKPQRPITYCYGSRPRPRIRHAAPFARRSYTASLSFLDDRWERVDSSSSLRQQLLVIISARPRLSLIISEGMSTTIWSWSKRCWWDSLYDLSD